jgi:acetyl-CoA acetyltransferase
MELNSRLSGKYAIAGLGMVMGVPEKELAKRKAELPNHPMLEHAISSPLVGLSARELEAEAARRAIEDAGLENKDIDGAVHVHGGPRSGRGLVEQMDAFPRMLGLPVNFYYVTGRGGGWGTIGIITATSFLEWGLAKYVVIAGSKDDWTRSHRKDLRDQGYRGQVQPATIAGMWGPVFGRIAAAHEHTMLASRHRYKYGTKDEQFGAAAVQVRAWACKNPLARMYGRPATLKDYEQSPIYIWPYHFMDMAVTSDGAVAMVLTSMERARDCKKPPVAVLGIGYGDAQGGQWWEGAEHYTKLPVAKAKEAAFGQAGITIKDVDMAQLYDCFTAELIFQLEDYGWCAKGEGGAYAEAGHIGPGGDTPVNTSGGLLSAYHMADLTGISESVFQLRGEAGERQIPNARIGFATGHGGEVFSPGLCSVHTTLVLGRM